MDGIDSNGTQSLLHLNAILDQIVYRRQSRLLHAHKFLVPTFDKFAHTRGVEFGRHPPVFKGQLFFVVDFAITVFLPLRLDTTCDSIPIGAGKATVYHAVFGM